MKLLGGYTVSSRDIEKIEKIQSDRKAANEFYSQNSRSVSVICEHGKKNLF